MSIFSLLSHFFFERKKECGGLGEEGGQSATLAERPSYRNDPRQPCLPILRSSKHVGGNTMSIRTTEQPKKRYGDRREMTNDRVQDRVTIMSVSATIHLRELSTNGPVRGRPLEPDG